MPTDRELLDAVLTMHRAAPMLIDDEQVCMHCTFFGGHDTYYVPHPCPTRKVIEGGQVD